MESNQKHVTSLPSIETIRQGRGRGRGRGRGQSKQSSNASVPVSRSTRNFSSTEECHAESALEQHESLSKEVYRKGRYYFNELEKQPKMGSYRLLLLLLQEIRVLQLKNIIKHILFILNLQF